jgi:hypothetical protein
MVTPLSITFKEMLEFEYYLPAIFVTRSSSQTTQICDFEKKCYAIYSMRLSRKIFEFGYSLMLSIS